MFVNSPTMIQTWFSRLIFRRNEETKVLRNESNVKNAQRRILIGCYLICIGILLIVIANTKWTV
jgi:uncharacterized membrane protein YidH (DUF202 family)